MKRLQLGLSLIFVLVFASAAIAGKGGGNGAARGVITVPDATYGGTTTAIVNPGGAETYVFAQCYAPDFGGTYVYAAYFPVDAANQAQIGPLTSSLWQGGNASCRAQEGYFARAGFGRWVSLATTTFRVTG